MVRSTATVAFNAIEVKGSLLPGSLLDQVAHFKAKQQGPKDYGLEKNARLRDRIDAAWVRAKDLWADYVGLKERAGQGAAALHFSLLLLREVFEWDDVQPVAGWQRGEAHYPITHRAFGGSVPLILKGVDTADLDQGLKQFGQENRKRSPHSCLQECLNADDGANWGLLCSGDRLRMLHDNASLVKPAYLGADLEWIVEGDLFDEFAVLWLTLHASRFRLPVDQGASQSGCVLDGWKREAEDTGERILNQLRGGVESALEHLGNGVLAHQANQALRLALESGELSRQAFHEELLRLVYRFLFLFTAEDRELLFAQEVGKEDPRRQIYREGYSLGRLRELALKRSAYEGNYGDLWQLQRLVFQQLSISHSPLGLPGLGGLFDTKQCPNLQACELDNRYLLRAIKAIGWFEAGGTLTRVNYRDLNTEELGSVYEGLLELHPQVEQVGSRMQLSYGAAAGSDRKTTGSYYTPDALVKLLIESALLPVIQERLSKAPTIEAKIQALLAIRVLDPACGSGHFLLAAGRRLALELARLRAGDDEPSEALRQQCLREVVARCLYGVDKNPMAVQLCKVALWIEAIDPGKPLSFLDAHIQCGDSLVGVFDPKVLEQGIPEEAYKPLTGDDKKVCSSLKKENASYRKRSQGSSGGLQGSLNLSGTQPSSQSQNRLHEIEAMPEDSLAESSAKQEAYASWLQDAGSDLEQLAADLYTAAFFLPKTAETRSRVPTTEHLLKLQLGRPLENADLIQVVNQASQDFRFFHWHLRFGDVMKQGGFDCVLGNPPWEMLQLDPREFFATRVPEIAAAANMAARNRLISQLEDERPDIFREFLVERLSVDGTQAFVHGSSRFPYTSYGRINLAPLFAELALNLISKDQRAGMIVPTGIATDSGNKRYFEHIATGGKLSSLISFFEIRKWFPGTDDRNPFCLITLGESDKSEFIFFAVQANDITDCRRRFTLESHDFSLLNPNTRTCPIFRSQTDAELAKKVYGRVPVLIDEARGEAGNPWGIKFNLMFMMNTDSYLFLDDPDGDCLPLYEAKLIHHYDHRWATYNSEKSSRDVKLAEKQNAEFQVTPRYWIRRSEVEAKLIAQNWHKEWVLGWREVCRATDERTMISSVIPAWGVSHKFMLYMPSSRFIKKAACLLANLDSLVFDFFARQKVAGTAFSHFHVKQLPVISPDKYDSLSLDFINQSILELTYTAHDLKAWAEDLGYDSPPFRFDPERRSLLRAELDAYYAHLYGLNRDELRYILDPADVMGPDYPSETFRVLKTNEIREFGEYRTQRLVLEAWDRLFGTP